LQVAQVNFVSPPNNKAPPNLIKNRVLSGKAKLKEPGTDKTL
tara:strand:- start:9701 stop:9826 length:126 start_codon:yes stop_codon:yes gene_type:complete